MSFIIRWLSKTSVAIQGIGQQTSNFITGYLHKSKSWSGTMFKHSIHKYNFPGGFLAMNLNTWMFIVSEDESFQSMAESWLSWKWKILFWILGNKQDTPNICMWQINCLSSAHFRDEGQSLSCYFQALLLSGNKETACTQKNLVQWLVNFDD